jgi:GAF domain-containing protein
MPEDLLTVVRNVARLMSLQRSGLLDTPPEETFDRFTRLASHLLRARTALLSLVDENRQFFKSATGLVEPWAGRRETPLTHSICKHVVEMGTGLVVPDGRVHPVLRGNPAVDECGFVAYAGMPVFAGDGHILGTLCVMDDKPREWKRSDLDALQDLAACVTEAIALRTHLRESERACRTSEARLREIEERRVV